MQILPAVFLLGLCFSQLQDSDSTQESSLLMSKDCRSDEISSGSEMCFNKKDLRYMYKTLEKQIRSRGDSDENEKIGEYYSDAAKKRIERSTETNN